MVPVESLAIQPNVYYTVEEAAQLLRVSQEAMLRLLKSGKAHGVKVGRQWRVLGAMLLDMSSSAENVESSEIADWLAVSSRTLREIWDNDEDAIYDQL